MLHPLGLTEFKYSWYRPIFVKPCLLIVRSVASSSSPSRLRVAHYIGVQLAEYLGSTEIVKTSSWVSWQSKSLSFEMLRLLRWATSTRCLSHLPQICLHEELGLLISRLFPLEVSSQITGPVLPMV